MENKLLAAIMDSREAFDTLESIKASDNFSDIGKITYEAVRAYYVRDNMATGVDKGLVTAYLERKYPKKADLFRTQLSQCGGGSVPNIIEEAMALRRRSVKDQLAAAFTVEDNDSAIDELLSEYERCKTGNTEASGEAKDYHGKTVEEILEKASSSAKIMVLPEAITEATDGGLLLGHHVLVFARPDCGKTTLAITMSYGFLKQGLPVLYVGNEDPLDDVLLRMLTRLTGMDKRAIEKDPCKAQRIADKRNFSNFYPIEMFPGTIREIEAAVIEIQPKILVVDQARNINMPGKLRSETDRLERVEREIRRLGKQYGMVTISFTQAGDSAHGRLILEMNDVDNSNTGMQSSADLMVGMGVNNDAERNGRRVLSFPKNKLGGSKEHRQVNFDPRYNRIY